MLLVGIGVFLGLLYLGRLLAPLLWNDVDKMVGPLPSNGYTWAHNACTRQYDTAHKQTHSRMLKSAR